MSELVQRVWDGRLRTNIGNVAALDNAAAFNPPEQGKTIIRVHGGRTFYYEPLEYWRAD